MRALDDIDDYWAETSERRRYSIPHSDGSFFSDGSGYSNGAVADLRHEIIERVRETIARLESIDLSLLRQDVQATGSNSDFLPHASEIEEAIRLSQRGLGILSSGEPERDTLTEWQNTFARAANGFVTRSLGLCGTFLDSGTAEAGKEFGKAIGKYGGIALVLYLCGLDFHGVAAAIGDLILKLP
ncbi:hypothetical protein [Mesorhizobium sp. M1322]|uniref:hypothetical protein n=1 Tax=Mesorhizobium sp. M1322 TaxID=2957081 RepID=UPI003337A85C